MFKDPLARRESNEQAGKMIKMKTREITHKLLEPQQTDPELINNLMNLCLLNKMADSHKN